MKSVTIKGLSDLPDAAELLITELRERNARVVALFGTMGAGKTTLIKEICRQLGVDPQEVNSPSFSIVNVYRTVPRGGGEGGEASEREAIGTTGTGIEGENIYHFDFYRIKNLEEAYDFGYEEYFFGGELCLVEWPEKIGDLLPPDAMIVRLTAVDEDTRTMEISD